MTFSRGLRIFFSGGGPFIQPFVHKKREEEEEVVGGLVLEFFFFHTSIFTVESERRESVESGLVSPWRPDQHSTPRKKTWGR